MPLMVEVGAPGMLLDWEALATLADDPPDTSQLNLTLDMSFTLTALAKIAGRLRLHPVHLRAAVGFFTLHAVHSQKMGFGS